MDAQGNFRGFGHAYATEAPVNGDNLIHEHFFEGTDRGEMIVILRAKFFELNVRFFNFMPVNDNLIGEDAVLDSIHPDDGLALRSFGASGMLGVTAVGFDGFRRHGFGHSLRMLIVDLM